MALSTLFLLAQDTPAVRVQAREAAASAEDMWHTLVHQSSALLTEYGFRVAGALIFLVVAWIASSWLMRGMVRGLMRAHVDVTLAKFLSNLARWGMLVLVIIACLGIFGVPATSFVTVLGTVGLAVGLAVQGSLSHLAAGIMLMIFRPFRVGDAVVVAGQQGVVDAIELFSTRLDTADNRRVIIPNGQIFGAIIVNITHHSERKIDVVVNVAGDADFAATRTTLLNAAATVPGLAAGRPVEVAVSNLSGGGVEWTVSVWATNADYGPVRQATLVAVKQALDAAGIAGLMPQMMVHAPGTPFREPAPPLPGGKRQGGGFAPIP